jgi:hypothetical protein
MRLHLEGGSPECGTLRTWKRRWPAGIFHSGTLIVSARDGRGCSARPPARQDGADAIWTILATLPFRAYASRIMVRRLLSAAALLLLLTSRAEAATIDLVFTVDLYAPIVGPLERSLSFTFFKSNSNGWPGSFPPQPFLASGGMTTLLPGVTSFAVSVDAVSLDDIYFNAYGSYLSGPGLGEFSLYVAEPPTGSVPDSLAFTYGPPWISLQNLGSGFSGNFQLINGSATGAIGTWALTPAAPVPEPTSLLLFGTGIAAVGAKKYRQWQAERSISPSKLRSTTPEVLGQ